MTQLEKDWQFFVEFSKFDQSVWTLVNYDAVNLYAEFEKGDYVKATIGVKP